MHLKNTYLGDNESNITTFLVRYTVREAGLLLLKFSLCIQWRNKVNVNLLQDYVFSQS